MKASNVPGAWSSDAHHTLVYFNAMTGQAVIFFSNGSNFDVLSVPGLRK